MNLILAHPVSYLVIRPTDVAGASSAVTPKRESAASFGPRGGEERSEAKRRNEREKKRRKKAGASRKRERVERSRVRARKHMCVNARGVFFAAAIAESSRA